MPTVPLHPALVHVPLGLAFVLPALAAGLVFAIRRALVPRRAWAVAVALQAVLVASGAAALSSGERDERRVERLVGGQAMEAHERAAKQFLWGAGVVLAVAAAALVAPVQMSGALAVIAAIATIGVAGLAYRTGEAGGEIVYARGGAAAFARAAAAPPGVAEVAAGSHRGHHHR